MGYLNLVRCGMDNIGMPRRKNEESVDVLSERITIAREAKSWSQAELARRAGISQPALRAIEIRETKEAKLSTIQRIADALGVPLAHLTGQDVNSNTEQIVTSSLREVPLVSWVQAGKQTAVFDPYQPGASEAWEPITVSASKYTFALRVRGDSMVARDGTGFPEGTTIIVDPALQARHNDFVVVRFNDSDEATFKRLVVDGPNRILRALNPDYPPITVTEDAHVSGVVVESYLRKTYR